MYRYEVTMEWYYETQIIESDTPLSRSQIRDRLDERRMRCDEISIEEIEDEDGDQE